MPRAMARHSHRFLAGVLLCCLLLSSAALRASGTLAELLREGWTEEQLAPGVQLRQRHFEELFGAPQFIGVLAVEPDPSGARVRFAAALEFDATEITLPEIAEKTGALAAINGGFFHGPVSLANSGIFKTNGKVLPFLKEEPEELRFVGGSAAGIDENERWHFMVRSGTKWEDDWKAMRHAIAGGHPLIIDGAIYPAVEQEQYAPREAKHAGARHPRTALGVTTNEAVLMVTIDGRHAGQAEGLRLKDTAALMKALGARNAINLDGGGSTTLWVRGKGIVNHPCDNRAFDHEGARRIRTAVIVTTGH